MFSNPLRDCYLAAQEQLAERLRAAQAKSSSPQETAYHLLAVYDHACTEALKHRQLHPYASVAKAFLQALQKALSPHIGDSPVSAADVFLFPPLSRLERHVQRFARLQHLASRHIQLQPIPTSALDGRTVFLPAAKVIIPTAIPGGVGYAAYALFFPNPEQKPVSVQPPEKIAGAVNFAEVVQTYLSSDIEQLTETPCFSLDDALDRYTNPHECCTIAFAQNAEYFPLVETALPIVIEKYERVLFLPE